jgi:hypothetical protein
MFAALMDPLGSGKMNRLTEHQAAGMSLTVIRIAMRIGMSCALIAVGAAGLFMVVRYMAWVE